MRYEMEGMAKIRRLVTDTKHGLTDEQVDAFKKVLATLEGYGFYLKGPEL